MRVVSGADGEAEGHQPRRPPQPPPASLLQNTLVKFLNNRCVFWTTDLAGPVKCGAMGQTFHGTCAYGLGSCLFAPKICSLEPRTPPRRVGSSARPLVSYQSRLGSSLTNGMMFPVASNGGVRAGIARIVVSHLRPNTHYGVYS